MRIKLDENIPSQLRSDLSNLGHDVDTVIDEGLTGKNDDTVWSAAQREQRFFITQDLDFSDSRRFQPGTHHGVLIVRLTDASRHALAQRILSIFSRERVERWPGCFIIVTEHKLRIRHPIRAT